MASSLPYLISAMVNFAYLINNSMKAVELNLQNLNDVGKDMCNSWHYKTSQPK